MAGMRASQVVILVILGAGAGAVIGPALMGQSRPPASTLPPAPASAPVTDTQAAAVDDDAWLRNTYDTREECLADYSEEECREGTSSSTGGGMFFGYFGPWYRTGAYAAGTPGPGRTAAAAGLDRSARTEVFPARPPASTQRGGFGGRAGYYGGRAS